MLSKCFFLYIFSPLHLHLPHQSTSLPVNTSSSSSSCSVTCLYFIFLIIPPSSSFCFHFFVLHASHLPSFSSSLHNNLPLTYIYEPQNIFLKQLSIKDVIIFDFLITGSSRMHCTLVIGEALSGLCNQNDGFMYSAYCENHATFYKVQRNLQYASVY